MEKIVEPFTSRIGEKITTSFDFNNNKQALEGNLEVLTSKAFDIETEVKKAELSGKKRRTMEVGSWLEKVKKFKEECGNLNETLEEAGISKTLWHGSHVKKLKGGAEELIKQSEAFRELVVDAYETSRERLFMSQLHGETLKQELDNILARVEANSDQVSIIGICGMGGVGKTNLAKHIHKKICMNFQGTPNKFHIYWVTISQEADINKLQNDLAKKLNFDLPKDYDIEEKAATLHKQLRDRKNVVLILDDVWKYFDLRQIGVLLGAHRCKVIITSRLLNVCDQMGCKKIINVRRLSEEEAWRLFLEKLDCVHELSPDVEKVAKKMAKKCAGLPLAIITIARSMIRVYDIHRWRDALEELKQSMRHAYMENEVLPILLHSYNRLKDKRWQQCFLYCSLYPEDYEIPRNELISEFIYEGMMHQRDNIPAEFDQGHTILDELVNMCLLESVVDSMGIKYVKMHDLLREMAVEITRHNPKFMRKAGFRFDEVPDEQDWTQDLDKVSLMYNRFFSIPVGSSPRCPQLSTLILSSTSLRLIPYSFFAHMRGLRVLNLRRTQIETLPNSLSELENLSALLLGGCHKLHYVPSLKKLEALMELDISETGIKRVPEGMECLVKLKCLNMRGTKELEEMPRGLLLRLPRLRRLLLPFHIKVQSEEIKSLKLVEAFVGHTDSNIFNSKWFNKSPPFSFYKILASDDIVDSGQNDFVGDEWCWISLERCTFKRSRGDVLLLPQNIQCLSFYVCNGLRSCLLDDVPWLYHSKDFQRLKIVACDEIESILRISSTSNDDGTLQNLKHLDLWILPNLIRLIQWEPRAAALSSRGTFSSLKVLNISECDKIKKLLPLKLAVYNLRNIEEIYISDCSLLEEIIADDEEDEGVGSTSNSRIIAFPKLKVIMLRSLPELDSICKEAEITCHDSIETIKISDCLKIKRLPFFYPSLDEKPSLPLTSSSSPSSSSSSSSSSSNNNNNNKYTNSIVFPNFMRIELCNLPELESIYERTINCCDSIRQIIIIDCPKIKRLPFFNPPVDEKQPIPFPRLYELRLHDLPEVKSICNGIMICDSIEFISIEGCKQLSRLPLYLPPINGQPSPPPSLQRIVIEKTEKEWWESLEWDHPNSNNILQPFLKYYSEIKIDENQKEWWEFLQWDHPSSNNLVIRHFS